MHRNELGEIFVGGEAVIIGERHLDPGDIFSS